MTESNYEIYTDGSCITEGWHKKSVGAWCAIILNDGKQTILKGTEAATTHNRMELRAVLNALEYVTEKLPWGRIHLYSDSQYVVQLQYRKEKLSAKNYLTKKGVLIRNADLVKPILNTIDKHNIIFVKVKAHAHSPMANNYNREADIICRKLARDYLDEIKNNFIINSDPPV